nr:hypothetical protein [Tanacetum cinerariifolium]
MEQELRLKRKAAERAFKAQAEKDRTLMRLEELRNETPLTLSWERIPRLDSGVRGYNTTRDRRINHFPGVSVRVYLRVRYIRGFCLVQRKGSWTFAEGKVGDTSWEMTYIPPFFMKTTGVGAALTATASRVIDMEDPDVATESSGTPSAIEKSPLDFDNENPSPSMTEGAASEVSIEEEVAAMGPRLSKKRRRRVNDGDDANAPPKVLRKDYASVRLEKSTRGGKSLPTMGLAVGSTFVTPADTK